MHTPIGGTVQVLIHQTNQCVTGQYGAVSRDVNKDLTPKDQNKDKDKDPTPKDLTPRIRTRTSWT